MDLIPSFTVDHTQIIPGIYESRVDILGDEIVTTFDVRIKKPNSEPAIAPAAMHTMEHVIATYLRNHDKWKDKLIYWGPMGCLTGFYLILKGNRASKELYELIQRLNNEGVAIIMISHDIPTAVKYSSKILHLGHKQLFFGKTSDYLESDAYKYFSSVDIDE